MWGPKIAYTPQPNPGKRTLLTQNAVILEKAGEFWREIIQPGNVRVACDVVYSRGWKTVVRRLQVPGTWRSDVDEYGGDGQVRCGPWTVWKEARGLWQQVNPRLVYRGKAFRGPVIRRQIFPTSADPPDVQQPVSFLPRVSGGSLYPAVAGIPFGSAADQLWAAFGKPPSSTCRTSAGLGCSWRTAVDQFVATGHPGLETNQGGAIRFRNILVSTKDPARSRLRGWTTPEGIHLGSTAADVKRLVEPLQCSQRSCEIDPRQPLHRIGSTRYRFFVTFTFDGRPTNAASRVTTIDVRQIDVEEGVCLVSISFGTPTRFDFVATCSGRVKAARLEAYNGSTALHPDPGSAGDGSWLLYEEDGRGAPQTAPRSVVRTRFTGGAHEWRVGCPEPIAGDRDPVYCAPGRPDGGAPAWRADVFERWELSLSGFASVRATNDRRTIPPLRFVAEFVDRDAFVAVLRQGD
jgi:hypothetical protein